MTSVRRDLHHVSSAEGGALLCSQCGYGIARPLPPARCPMCQARGQLWLPSNGQRLSSARADRL